MYKRQAQDIPAGSAEISEGNTEERSEQEKGPGIETGGKQETETAGGEVIEIPSGEENSTTEADEGAGDTVPSETSRDTGTETEELSSQSTDTAGEAGEQIGGGEESNTEQEHTEPTNMEPANTEPVNTEPVNTEPANTEPANTEPANTEPANTERINTDSVQPEETDVKTIHERCIRDSPYTVLTSAGSYLDWLLMSLPKSGKSIITREIPLEELVGEEVIRQVKKQISKEELLQMDVTTPGNRECLDTLQSILAFRLSLIYI